MPDSIETECFPSQFLDVKNDDCTPDSIETECFPSQFLGVKNDDCMPDSIETENIPSLRRKNRKIVLFFSRI